MASSWKWKPVGISISALIIFSSLAYLLSSGSLTSTLTQGAASQQHDASSRPDEKSFRAPATNPFAELDDAEASQIYTFLHQSASPWNDSGGTASSSNIYLIELLRPNKSDVVDYLDHNGPLPERWARLSNLEAHKDAAFIVEYMVGPLPPSNKTQILPLTYCYNSGRNRVQSPLSDVFGLLDWALSIGENASDITQDLLSATTNREDPADPDALVIGSRPALVKDGRMVHWLEFFGPGMESDSRSLLPQGLYVKLEIPTPHPATWKTAEWFYNGVLYENDTALRDAMTAPGFVRLNLNRDGSWTDTEDFTSSFLEREMLPPLSIQPYGPRYHLDRSQNYISWMGFSFYLSTAQATALSLFDIRYDSTRLIYQLGLQEALAHYAGVEPMQSGLEFLDTFFGMGSMMFSLVPGVDCPGHAEYIDMSYHKGGKMYTNRNAICVFEYTSDAPLQRHTSACTATVSRNTYLVVRSVSTVGNYDYTIDYIFYLDGSIEVKLRASGFIFGAFHAEPRPSGPWTPSARDASTNEYGYSIHPAVHTSMHDHVVSFRADVDICGTANTLVRTSIEPLQRSYGWDQPEVRGARNTMHMVHTAVTHETGLDWPRNGGDMYLVTAANATNRWGETRAYRILPGTGMGNPAHLTILNSTTLARSAAWSARDLWVLRNHPASEPASAHHLNYLEPLDPLVDFGRMLDDEPVEQEDLVLYFNLGGHHVPSSQDVPNTLMHTSASSVLFMPFNYFDHDVSRGARQGVRIDRRPRRGQRKDKTPLAAEAKEDIRRRDEAASGSGGGSGSDNAIDMVTDKTIGTDRDVDRDTARDADGDRDSDGDGDGVSYFGARYTSPVLVDKAMLSPDLGHYMKEREDGQAEGEAEWVPARNNVGGGLLGLFVGKERQRRPEDNKGSGSGSGSGRLDW